MGSVVELWSGRGQCESAVVRGPDHEGKGWAAAGRASLGERIFADEASGRAVPGGEGSGAVSGQSGGRQR